MTYLSGKVQKRNAYIRYALYGIIFVAVLFFWPKVKQTLYPAVEPVVIGYSGTKETVGFLPDFFRTYFTTHSSLLERERELEIQIEHLENEIADKDALLRISGIEATASTSSSYITMYPLMQDVTRLYSTVLLSKGSKDGVIVGQTVYLRGNQAVCTIKEVYTSTSLCLLFTSSSVVTEGVTSSSSITLSLVGRGGAFLADVARDTPVEVGEKVYLRSNPTMTLGTVKQVINNNQDTSWHIFVEGGYNPLTSSIFYVQP